MHHFDLAIIGGGSGGAGAAITAGCAGLRTLWVERESLLGGTGVNAFVNVWQPAYSASALAPEIAERLIARTGVFTLAPPSTRRAGGLSTAGTRQHATRTPSAAGRASNPA